MTTLRREEVRLALRFGGLHVTRALLSLLSIAAIGWLTDTLVDRRIGQAMVVLVGFGVITTLGYLSEPLGTYVKNVGTARLEERLTPQIMRAMTSVPSVDLLCVEPRATFERLVPEAPRTIVKLHASTWLLVEIFIQCIGISAMMANAGAGFLMIPSWIILLFFSFVGIRLGLVRARFDRSIGVQRSRGAYLMSIFTDREPAEEVRSFDVTEPFLSEWNRVNASARRSLDLREWIYYGFLKLPVLGVSAALGLQLVGPARRLVDGGISIGTFVSLVLGLLSLLTSISWSLSESFENWGQAYAQRRELLRLIGGISGADPAQTFAERAPRGPLQLHDVCFRFPNQDRTVLEVPDLLLEPGKRYVITGPNGSGKTTLMRCLSRIFTERDGGGDADRRGHRGHAPRWRPGRRRPRPASFSHLGAGLRLTGSGTPSGRAL